MTWSIQERQARFRCRRTKLMLHQLVIVADTIIVSIQVFDFHLNIKDLGQGQHLYHGTLDTHGFNRFGTKLNNVEGSVFQIWYETIRIGF